MTQTQHLITYRWTGSFSTGAVKSLRYTAPAGQVRRLVADFLGPEAEIIEISAGR